MTTYSICSPKTGTDLGRFEAGSASEALDALARASGYRDLAHAQEAQAGFSDWVNVTWNDLVATAVGLPEVPADEAFFDHQWSPEDIARMGEREHKPFVFNATRPVPEASAPAACPFKLPLSVGNSAGQSPDQIYDTTDQAVLILYSVDSRGTVDEARTMSWNQHGLVRGDYVVKAVNEHEGLVQRLKAARKWMGATPHGENCFLMREGEFARCMCGKDSLIAYLDGDAQNLVNDNLGLALEMSQQLTAKPVDRRKD